MEKTNTGGLKSFEYKNDLGYDWNTINKMNEGMRNYRLKKAKERKFKLLLFVIIILILFGIYSILK